MDYHRRLGALSCYNQLKELPQQDMFIIWDYMTSSKLTTAEEKTYNFLISKKYDLLENLETLKISPFVKKYLIIKFGKKGQ